MPHKNNFNARIGGSKSLHIYAAWIWATSLHLTELKLLNEPKATQTERVLTKRDLLRAHLKLFVEIHSKIQNA